MVRSHSVRVALALALVLLPGCARKLTREDFESIQVNVDDQASVERKLGEPDRTLGTNGEEWLYGSAPDEATARIFFGPSGKVGGKQWIDGESKP